MAIDRLAKGIGILPRGIARLLALLLATPWAMAQQPPNPAGTVPIGALRSTQAGTVLGETVLQTGRDPATGETFEKVLVQQVVVRPRAKSDVALNGQPLPDGREAWSQAYAQWLSAQRTRPTTTHFAPYPYAATTSQSPYAAATAYGPSSIPAQPSRLANASTTNAAVAPTWGLSPVAGDPYSTMAVVPIIPPTASPVLPPYQLPAGLVPTSTGVLAYGQLPPSASSYSGTDSRIGIAMRPSTYPIPPQPTSLATPPTRDPYQSGQSATVFR
ncbi:MAG: hypothetical protein ACK5S3_09185 [Pirellulaceae bacterium]|jgi:hypothetical protein